MSHEALAHTAEQAPLGHKIEVYDQSAEAVSVEVDRHALPEGAFDEAVDKFSREVPPEHEDALEYKETYSDGTLPAHQQFQPRDRSMDVVTTGTSLRRKATIALAAGSLAAAVMATDMPGRIGEAFSSKNTGKVAAERDRKVDAEVQQRFQNTAMGKDGKIRFIPPSKFEK